MKWHRLKLNSRWFQEVYDRRKTFEVRFDDREFEVGDYLALQEVVEKQDGTFERTGREVTAKVDFILRAEDFPAGLKEGYVVMAIDVLARS